MQRRSRRTGATIISSFEICEWFGKKGIEKSHAMNIGGGHPFPFGRVKMTIAHHTSTMPDGSPGGVAAGFLLTLPEGNAYFACDTALFYDMKLIGEAGLALAALPIGDNFTMGPDDALRGETARTETRRSHPSGHVAADRPGRPRLGRGYAPKPPRNR